MRSSLLFGVVALTSACAPRPCAPPTAAAPQVAALGETLSLQSEILGERRVINVYVPPDYESSNDRYPVLYMPDGGMKEDFPHVVGSVDVSIKNAVIRPLIVVGIENTERRRDLVGPTSLPEEREIAPHAGGSERFRAFLRDELEPLVTERYRTTAESAIIGESFAGLFVIETLLVEPTLFDGYIAADPSLWWNERTLVRGAGARLLSWSAGPKTLYVATSGEPSIQDGVVLLTAALEAAAAAELRWAHEPMPGEGHHTIFPTAALHGVRALFATP